MEASTRALGFALRHGERADAVPEYFSACEIAFDPPLTPEGFQQARDAAEVLRPYCAEFNKEDVRVYSSPLVRCLQTAAQVIVALGLQATHKIHATSQIIEEIIPCHFPKDPLKEGLVATKSHEYITETYLNNIDFDNTQVKPLSYPEFYSETTQRLADGFYSILQRHEHQHSLTIMVTHGRAIEEFNRYFGESVTELCDYCGISGAEKKTPTSPWTLFMSNNNIF